MSSTINTLSPIIVALDYAEERALFDMVARLHPSQCRLKVGKEVFTAFGPSVVRRLVDQGFDVFLDLKFHDIPNTVARAVAMAADLGVWMVNVHASGGRRMMESARDALNRCDHQPLLIAVTVLTSMDAEDLQEVGVADSPAQQVLRLARLAKDCGLDGVVCSGQEVGMLKKDIAAPFCTVTPGIRPVSPSRLGDDQRRVLTPTEAIRSGSDYLVIGRPITKSDDPLSVLKGINEEISRLG